MIVSFNLFLEKHLGSPEERKKNKFIYRKENSLVMSKTRLTPTSKYLSDEKRTHSVKGISPSGIILFYKEIFSFQRLKNLTSS